MSTRPEAKAYRKKYGIPYDPKDLNALEDLTTEKLRELLEKESKKGGGTLSNRKPGKGKPYRSRPKRQRKQKSDPHRTAFPRAISVKRGGKIMQGYKAGGKV